MVEDRAQNGAILCALRHHGRDFAAASIKRIRLSKADVKDAASLAVHALQLANQVLDRSPQSDETYDIRFDSVRLTHFLASPSLLLNPLGNADASANVSLGC